MTRRLLVSVALVVLATGVLRSQGRGPVVIGPPAPVPAEVAMLRPSADELARVNDAVRRLIESDKSADRAVLN